jgi:long-chain acyl-CoA synthetase
LKIYLLIIIFLFLGKVFKKFHLGDYSWSTYEEIGKRVIHISNGLLKVGLESEMNVILFAETRAEWLMSALSCFRIKVPIVTLYSTLGTEAVAYGINQTNASYLITSGDQLSKIQNILQKIPNIKNVIVFDDKFTEKSIKDFRSANTSVKLYSLSEIEKIGKQNELINTFTRPKRDDLAIIMYTSGSTGKPKGVMINHGNLLSGIRGLITHLGSDLANREMYVAYLPLAHVLELCCELGSVYYGIRVGYSSSQTITDASTGIKKDQKGDLRMLKPTIMPAVPVGYSLFYSLYTISIIGFFMVDKILLFFSLN